MRGCCSTVEVIVVGCDNTIHSIIFNLPQPRLEHQIGHSIIRVSMEIPSNINCPLIKVLLIVSSIFFQLMSVYEVIDEQ